jgi:hypothetical protein
MVETYDSVLDRIGAFNAATEKLAKARVSEVLFEMAGRPELRLRLSRREDSYAIELAGAPDSAAEALRGMGFEPGGSGCSRQVRKSERSWNVASQLEDILQEALALGSDVAISVEV